VIHAIDDAMKSTSPPTTTSAAESNQNFFWKNWKWNIHVIESPIANAACLPGGTIVIYTGILDFAMNAYYQRKIQSPVDAIAQVIAHEISHSLARHVSERLSWLPIQIPFLFLSTGSELLREPFTYVFRLPHSRQMENEADTMSVSIALQAGFDPRQGAALLQLFTDGSTKLVGDWLSTHPSGDKRFVHIDSETTTEEQKNATNEAMGKMTLRRIRKNIINPYQIGKLTGMKEMSPSDLVIVTQKIWDWKGSSGSSGSSNSNNISVGGKLGV
jgi:predicted Zn-dependent protease